MTPPGKTARRLPLLAFAAASALSLPGCHSPVKTVAHSFTQIQQDADIVYQKADAIQRAASDAASTAPPAESAVFHSIDTDSKIILSAVTDAKKAAIGGLEANTQTTDKTSEWVPIIKWGLIAAAVIAALVTLWQTGALGFIRGFLGLVTPATRTQAKFMAEALNSDNPDPTLREHVAVLRNSPAFNAQFIRAQKKLDDPPAPEKPA